jgi:hypothetical protein
MKYEKRAEAAKGACPNLQVLFEVIAKYQVRLG